MESSAVELSAAPTSGKFIVVLRTGLRIVLGMVLLLYGLQKITNEQIQLSAWSYAQPLLQNPGTSLTWAFLGYQPWFQCLTGFMEAIPGLLLLSRRGWRLGALIALPVLLNVALMNFAMDLWSDTRGLSAVLLLMDVALVALSFAIYRPFLRALIARPAPLRRHGWNTAANAAGVVLALFTLGAYVPLMNAAGVKRVHHMADFIGVRQINGAGTWTLQSASFNGQEVPGGEDRKVYFDFWGKCYFVSGAQTLKGNFKADNTQHTFEITGVALDGDAAPIDGTYKVDGNQLVLNGTQNNKPVVMTLKREKWGPLLPFGS